MDPLAPALLGNLDRNGTLGMGYLGAVVSALIYGITCIQTFQYYRSPKSQGDPSYIRAFVLLLWVLDTVHQVFVVYAFYHYLVIGYGLPSTLIYLSWSIPASLVTNDIIFILIRCFFLMRVWLLSRNKPLVAILGLLALARFSVALYYSSQVSDNTVSKILLMVVGSSTLSAIIAIATLFAYTLAPTKLYNLFFEFILETIDVNAVLTSLNSREFLNQPVAPNVAINVKRPVSTFSARADKDRVRLNVYQVPTLEVPTSVQLSHAPPQEPSFALSSWLVSPTCGVAGER
ncbi:hypothetical protein C8T65DRAFT_827520 [Cerioporus squamosus]|nr:hypothetical protein C8T65DRAFT_827520 [Cerioporus squamosus]